jgi:hypothetical protein
LKKRYVRHLKDRKFRPIDEPNGGPHEGGQLISSVVALATLTVIVTAGPARKVQPAKRAIFLHPDA